jgi:hypothetical protein
LKKINFSSVDDCLGLTFFDGTDPTTYDLVSSTVDLEGLGTTVAAGDSIFFKWVASVSDEADTNPKNYNGLAIDDLNIVFTWASGTSSSTGTSGDPHFYGFLGQKYDVMGQSYEIYNIITAPYLQINSQFTPYYKRANQIVPTGTMMGSLGIKFYAHSILANSNSSFIVLDENQEVRLDEEWTLNFDGGIIISNVPAQRKSVLTIETPDIVLSFIRKAYYVSGLEAQWHYDYKARILNINTDFHG